MTAITRSSRKSSSNFESSSILTSSSNNSSGSSLSTPSSIRSSVATTANSANQPSTSIEDARTKLMAAVARSIQELVDRDGYSRGRAAALLVRQIRRDDDPPKDDDIFRLMSSSSDPLSREDATTILTLASALRRIRSENSISELGAVDQLTSFFCSRTFSIRNEEEKSLFDDFATEQPRPSKLGSGCSADSFLISVKKNHSDGSHLTPLTSGSTKTAAATKNSVKLPSSSAKRKAPKGCTNNLTTPTSTCTTSNDKMTSHSDEDVLDIEERMEAESSEEKSIITITNTLNQRLTRKRVVDHLPPSNKRVRGTPLGKM